MAVEIERKFLVSSNAWQGLGIGVPYCQGYLTSAKGCTVRVRVAGPQAFLTIKGPTQGASRTEFEYEIPLGEAQEMLSSLAEKPLIEKVRYTLLDNGFTWEIDEFSGENTGLVVAEIELADENQHFPKPAWLGKEVTGDPRYYNSNLGKNPFSKW